MQFRGSYAHVYNYSNSILKTSADACFNNHLKDLGYLDFCGNAHKTFKNFTIDQRIDINIFGSKFFSSAKFWHHETSLGLRRTFANTYIQNQLVFRTETLHKSGVYSKVSAIFGDALTGKLVMWKSLRGSFRTQFLRKPLSVSLGSGPINLIEAFKPV